MNVQRVDIRREEIRTGDILTSARLAQKPSESLGSGQKCSRLVFMRKILLMLSVCTRAWPMSNVRRAASGILSKEPCKNGRQENTSAALDGGGRGRFHK